ncbi:MAG TPA: NrsF family protein [Methylocella sp.]|nr:NrsF family protein [Methylocella sp.]
MLAMVPVLQAAANLFELFSVPAALWRQKLIGTTNALKSIPFLGLAPLAAALFCLRQGAPEHPALAGKDKLKSGLN